MTWPDWLHTLMQVVVMVQESEVQSQGLSQ